MKKWWLKHREMTLLILAAVFLFLAWRLHVTPRVYVLGLTPVEGMSEAGIYYYSETEHPKTVVLLANMYNNTRRTWIDDPVWRRFALERQCALVELAFASPLANLSDGSGYYFPAEGSGQLLLEALDRLWPEQPPLLLYGFSGGAQFAARFAAWAPERVQGWAAYAAGLWDAPTAGAPPEAPGVVICGELDSRWQASSNFFRAGIDLGKPWLWIGVAGNDHLVDPRINEWVSRYFAGILDGAGGKWVERPDERGWLAVAAMEEEWRDLNRATPYHDEEPNPKDDDDDENW